MGEEGSTCITWKSGFGSLHLDDLRKYGMVVIKYVVLMKCGKTQEDSIEMDLQELQLDV